ncbi:hypothetical protein AVEN_100565-1 [Araneus ventricosus]|uniref:NYN domain-containing protein n=1 Tax=Araneus ventricosus TaxID=182803 RepID=A0A4Y2FFH7_ARAVE|nr:hypothetical protein AVEN_100565-1 [Araneus ventricosus]
MVVFDGNPEETTTKNEEQNRRASKHSSCDIAFEENTICVTAREDFLGNKTIKKMTLALGSELRNHGLSVITAEEDADVDIVLTAINKINTSSNVMVVGSDTDLIVLWIALSPGQKKNFVKKKSGAIHSTVLHKIETLIESTRIPDNFYFPLY